MLMYDEIKAAVEAILFVRSEQVDLEELVEVLGVPGLELKAILDELILEYNSEKRGIQILALDNGYLMCTKQEYSDILCKMEKPLRRRLSAAALETLAIIAYQQPVTRAEIEKIRGVKSDKIINNLLEKGLIEEAGRKAVPGKPILYVTSKEFLQVFGLSSLSDLPVIEEV
ncbi:MAG: SMC-Scp complex subunit ScpB [Syntrophomonadaceae bacterium]|nr:SMC-Scp complex subunit ScpB [Syntrophomonadaceae bacterium]